MGLLVAMTIPGLACLLIALAFAEVLWHRLTGRRAMPWSPGDRRPVAATGFEEVTALFQGSKHHEFAQRHTVLMHREDLGDGAPPRDVVDLDAGAVALLRRETQAAPTPSDTSAAAGRRSSPRRS